MLLNVADIDASPTNNCRAPFELKEVATLMASIEEVGLLQNLVVTPGTDKPWKLVSGFRRFTAVRMLKWEQVECNVLKGGDVALANLVENIQREDLDPVAEAKAINNLFPEESCRFISAKVGKSANWVWTRQALSRLPPEIQVHFASRAIPMSRLGSVSRAKDQEKAVKTILGRTKSKRAYVAVTPQKRRTKEEVFAMTVFLMERNITGIPSRLLAWGNAGVSTEEMKREILESLK